MIKKGLMIASLMFSLAASASDIIEGTGTINYVTDGDTYWIKADRQAVWTQIARDADSKVVRFKDLTFKARILNINTEESVHRNKAKNTAFGKAVSKLVKREITAQKVSFTCNGVGKYKRPLCSVYINGHDYAKSLVERGLSAYITRYGKHFNDHAGYAAAELSAKRNRLGIWSANKEYYIANLPSQRFINQ